MGETDEPSGELSTGEVLARRYKITDFLGHGGMGVVYAALDLRSATPVAIKLPRREMRSRKKALARFGQESRAAARLKGPHVVRVLDIAELDDGTPFIVMELLVGRDLASELETRGALPVGEAVDYVLQAASGVAEAHANGIVHRDLKPHNLFLVGSPVARWGPGSTESRIVKVLDFGISKMGGAEVARVTTTNARLGTPLYVSPEQLVSAKHVDGRSDIWSLGVILYELLTGALPFEGESAIAVAAAIQTKEPVPPSARVPGLPPELERAVLRALSKKADLRFDSVSGFALALAPFGASGSFKDAPRSPSAAPRAPGPLRPGGTLEDSTVVSGASPPEEDAPSHASSTRSRTLGASRSETAKPSLLLVALAALFGIALLALAFLYR